MSGYNLEHFELTMGSSYANGNSATILARYPFLVSRKALYAAINKSGLASDSQRNPNSYTATQITDKIIAHWDRLMTQHWEAPEGQRFETPLAFQYVQDNYNWGQQEFWTHNRTEYIATTFHPLSTGRTAAQIVAATDLIILPSFTHDIDAAQYKRKPFLAFDHRETQIYSSVGSGSFTPCNTDEFGVELDVNGGNQITGITSSGTTDEPNNDWSGKPTLTMLLKTYDYNFYHDDLNPNGSDFSVQLPYTGANNIETSTKWFDLRAAKFSVTIDNSTGKVTAITPVARNDGNGVSRTGGWGYSATDNDYQELYFIDKIPQISGQLRPRVLFRANTNSDVSGAGKKATVDITDPNSEFYAGDGQTTSYIDTAFAVFGLGDRGYSATPTTDTAAGASHNFRQWPSAGLKGGINPSVVRINSERPVLTSQTRSLRTTVTATGAQRFTFEFEYPPMSEAVAQVYIKAFEEYKGASLPLQLWIPSMAIQHMENWLHNNRTGWMNRLTMDYPQQTGDNVIVLGGQRPGDAAIVPGTFFKFAGSVEKIYQITGSNGNVDDYGRVAYTIEPPLLSTGNSYIAANSDGTDTFGDGHFRVRAELVDETLDYSVDAAGIYRMSFKFRESIG
tara:strand:+ start:10161 stop:12020 length:1860 start_codon:yes stop_codon:yes gene_type:complete